MACLSPGPGAPAEASVIIDTIRWAAEAKKPLLGVCLGHLAIAGGIRRHRHPRPELMRLDLRLVHENVSVFKDVPCPSPRPAASPWRFVPESMPGSPGPPPPPTMASSWVCATAEAPCGGAVPPRIGPDRSGYLMLAGWLEEIGLRGAAARAKSLCPSWPW